VTQKVIDELTAMTLAPVAIVILRHMIPRHVIASLVIDKMFRSLEALGDDVNRLGQENRSMELNAMQWIDALRMVHSIHLTHDETAISDGRYLLDDIHTDSNGACSAQQVLTRLGLDLILLLYHVSASASLPSVVPSSVSSHSRMVEQLRTEHFNIVLRLAMIAKDHSTVQALFHLMHPLDDSGSDDGLMTITTPTGSRDGVINAVASESISSSPSSESISSSHSSESTPSSLLSSESRVVYIPNTFTIAELIRCARATIDVELLARVVVWSVQHMVYVPMGLISDAISMLYR